MISIDILGPYAKSQWGNEYAIIALDLFTKWTKIIPNSSVTSRRVIAFLEREIFARWGVPEVIIAEKTMQFMDRAYQKLLELNHITHHFAPIYHQRANPVERRVQEVKKMPRSLLIGKTEREWENQLHTVLYCNRNRENSAISQTPAEILLGYTPPRPGT